MDNNPIKKAISTVIAPGIWVMATGISPLQAEGLLTMSGAGLAPINLLHS